MTRPYRVAIAPSAAEVIRTLHPDLKRSVRNALSALQGNPTLGAPLRNELDGLWRYRVRRYRIVYGIERASREIRVVAVGPRSTVYEDLAESKRNA